MAGITFSPGKASTSVWNPTMRRGHYNSLFIGGIGLIIIGIAVAIYGMNFMYLGISVIGVIFAVFGWLGMKRYPAVPLEQRVKETAVGGVLGAVGGSK